MWESQETKDYGSTGQGTAKRQVCYSDTLSTQQDLTLPLCLPTFHFSVHVLSSQVRNSVIVCLHGIKYRRA